MKLSFEQLRDAIRAALRVLLGEPYSSQPDGGWGIVATFEDAVIVQKGISVTFVSYPVSVDSLGKVSLGDPVPVGVTYTALKEAHGSVILGPVIEEATAGKPGSKWAVCVIQEGISENRTFYSADVLRAATPLYEGAKVFWNHKDGSQNAPAMRDPRDIAGFLRAPKAALIEGVGKVGVLATLHATTASARERLLEAHEAGNPALYGLSHTAVGEYERIRHIDGKPAIRVKKVVAVESVDIVSFPSAGGRVMRLVAGMASPVPVTPEELMNLEQMLKRLQEGAADLYALLSKEPTEGEVAALLKVMETRGTQPPVVTPPTPPPAPAPVVTPTPDAPKAVGLSDADRALLHEARVDHVMKGRTFGRLEGLARKAMILREGATEVDLKAIADEYVTEAAKLEEGIKGTGQGATGADVTVDEADKLREGVEGFFWAGASDRSREEYKKITGKDAPREGFRSLRRMYEALTGDLDVTGFIQDAQGLRRFNRLMEAIGTGTLANVFRSTLNRRLIAEYRSLDVYQKWRRVVSAIVPLSDFRNQERVRMGSFADLAIVPQLGAYPELADPTDELVSYAPAKRGGIVSISREAIKNDDVGLVRQFPMKIALSAARSLHSFVMNLIITNPTLDDSIALFAASASRGASSAGNIITTALSAANISVARQRMLRVRDRDSNTVLGISPKILIVPPELEELAIRLTSIPVFPVSGQNATEPNYIATKYGLNEYMVLETMADANDYFILADPRVVETIEVGFVDGQEEPVLLMQDAPTEGSVFTADKFSWKARHEYGGDVVEWRGMQGGIVA